jgi:hypothetical protein
VKTVAERIFESLDRYHEYKMSQLEAVTSDPSQQANDRTNPETSDSGKRKKKSKKESNRTTSDSEKIES